MPNYQRPDIFHAFSWIMQGSRRKQFSNAEKSGFKIVERTRNRKHDRHLYRIPHPNFEKTV